MSSALIATRMTKKYRVFLPEGAKVLNYKETASGRDCDICGHTPQKLPPKEGYPDVSEEMRQMRVRLEPGTQPEDFKIGAVMNFTVTGDVVEINVCKDTVGCRTRAAELRGPDGEPRFDPKALAFFR